jgi:hypothetical protein
VILEEEKVKSYFPLFSLFLSLSLSFKKPLPLRLVHFIEFLAQFPGMRDCHIADLGLL